MKRLALALAALLLAAAGVRAQVSARDHLGKTVTLPAPAQRIVSLAPHATELLFAAGAGARVVGAVDWSDFPPEAREVPRVGSYVQPDLERIVALQPDLVVAWYSGNDPRVVERLRALGYPVYVTELRDLEHVPAAIERLGRLAGSEAAAAQAAAAYRARRDALAARYSGKPAVGVFYQIWDKPLMTINGEHLISRVMELCGGRNVFGDLPTLTPHLNVERVIVANPQAIVASGMGEARPDWLADWRRWPELAAVRNGHLFFVPSDFLQRPTPRVLDGAQMLCEALDRVRDDLARAGGERRAQR
ncbi:MAG: cobalamin-binding protein [Pseudomonadota bacterium]